MYIISLKVVGLYSSVLCGYAQDPAGYAGQLSITILQRVLLFLWYC